MIGTNALAGPLGRAGQRLALFALALLLGSCRVTEPPAARAFGLVIPVYNEAGLSETVGALRPHLRPDDRFMIVSGNTSGVIDTAWINRAALTLREAFPAAPIYAATSGLNNVAKAARETIPVVEAVVYIYEPNFPNQPEFTWEFPTTLDRFADARAHAEGGGFRAVGKPTGRPLLQENLQTYGWNYGALAENVGELFIQTQTYCKESPAAFARALDTLAEQYGGRANLLPWTPQITIAPAPTAPNGTSVAQAIGCLKEVRKRNLPGVVLWWSPEYTGRAVAFIAALNEETALQNGARALRTAR